MTKLKLQNVLIFVFSASSLFAFQCTVRRANGDSPMWGGGPGRNMASDATGLNWDFDLTKDVNVEWSVPLGSLTYCGPTVINGRVLVGTNNGGKYRPDQPADCGVLLCFEEATGKFLWQLSREKLDDSLDFPEVGISSVPMAEKDRVWLVTNRCELMCLDLDGFHDGENDGEVKDEAANGELDADVVWSLDMLGKLGVTPHFSATSSPVVYGDLVFACTSQGITAGDSAMSDPNAPSFIAANKTTGEIVWKDNSPGAFIRDGQWSSPAIGIVNGQPQVVFPAGDGWLYSFKPGTGELIWKCDLNPKATIWEEGGVGDRNAIVATPVFFENSVVIGVGQNPDHGDGTGYLWRIDATKKGDVSAELGEPGTPGEPNPNSAVVWHYGGEDEDGSVTGDPGEAIFHRTISTVAVAEGLVFAADHRGQFHVIDFETGKRLWDHDLLSTIWGSPFYVDGRVLIGTEDGKLVAFPASREKSEPLREYDAKDYNAIYSTPVIANKHLYLVDRSRLYRVTVIDP